MNSVFRSLVFKRGLSSIRQVAPPNIAMAATKIASEPSHAPIATEEPATAGQLSNKDFEKMVEFYKRIPKGSVPPPSSSSLSDRYRAKYFDSNSFAPIVHLILGLLVGGYSIHYFMHIRHHKSAEHH